MSAEVAKSCTCIYDKQLEFKTDLLHQALKKFAPAGYENYEIRPTIGMQEPKYYRAKLQFQTRKFKNQVRAAYMHKTLTI